MKKYLVILLTLALLVGVLFTAAQQTPPGASPLHRVGGVFYAPVYNSWRSQIIIGNSATGSQAITVGIPNAGPMPGLVTLADGYTFVPFAVNETLLVGIGSNQETVTVSAVSNCPPAGPVNPVAQCTLTATFANTHGAAEPIFSGSQGIIEAINDAQNQNGGQVYWEIDTGNVTLSTVAANTNLGSINIPTRSIVMGATARVTTTIGTCAGGWSLGFSTGTEFTAANTTLAAGTTTDSSTLATPVAFNAAATVPIAHCTTSNASAGAIHAKLWGYKLAAPAQ